MKQVIEISPDKKRITQFFLFFKYIMFLNLGVIGFIVYEEYQKKQNENKKK